MNIRQWAVKWGVPFEAVAEMEREFGLAYTDPTGTTGKSEAAVASAERLAMSKAGGRLWRNNVGACKDQTGRVVRYGLANESKQMNTQIKSADLIGIQPILITATMVGQTIGQFVSIETKKADWSFVGDEHEIAQLEWVKLVTRLGGQARFSNGKGVLV